MEKLESLFCNAVIRVSKFVRRLPSGSTGHCALLGFTKPGFSGSVGGASISPATTPPVFTT